MTWLLLLLVCAVAPSLPDSDCRTATRGPFAVECRAGPPRPGQPCDPGSCGAARDLARTLADVRYAMCVEGV